MSYKEERVWEISQLAVNKQPLSNDSEMSDWLLYYRLRDIYQEHSAGLISFDEGAERKIQAVKQYERDDEHFDTANKIIAWHGKWWAEIELAAKAYTDNPCVETADAFFNAVYHTKRKRDEEVNLHKQ